MTITVPVYGQRLKTIPFLLMVRCCRSTDTTAAKISRICSPLIAWAPLFVKPLMTVRATHLPSGGRQQYLSTYFTGEVELNDNTNANNPLTLGETVAGRLSNYEDEDRYTVALDSNEPVIETQALCDENTDTILKVFDPNGILVAVNDNDGLAKIQHFLPRVSGTFEVEVLGRNSAVGLTLPTLGTNRKLTILARI